MPLFTDGVMSDQEDLREFESSILGVAHAEAIELAPKLRVAQREVGFEVTTFLLRYAPEAVDLNAGLTNVVVTPQLRHWHVVHTLAGVYRDAYFSRLNDRFKEKWQQFSLLTRDAKEAYFASGVAVVQDPVPRPQSPECSSVTGGTADARSCLVSFAWNRGDITGSASAPIAVELGAGTLLRVRAAAAPNGITGWSVYVSNDGKAPTRQNDSALPLGGVWTEPSGGLLAGAGMPEGQTPGFFVRSRNILGRG